MSCDMQLQRPSAFGKRCKSASRMTSGEWTIMDGGVSSWRLKFSQVVMSSAE